MIKYLILITSDLPDGVDEIEEGDLDDMSFVVGGAFANKVEAEREAARWANGRTNMEVVLAEVKSRKYGRILSKAERAK